MGAVSHTAIVYQARNVLNGHRYIGFTTQGLEIRKAQHLKSARVKQPRFRFQHAINKHGPENFVFEVLGDFDGDEDLAKLYEIEAIAKYKPEYNLSYGGDGGSLSAETKAKISASHMGLSVGKGVPKTEEHRRNMRKGMKGVPHLKARGKSPSAETRSKISAANMGHPNHWHGVQGEEARAKIRAANQGKLVSAETRAKLASYKPWITGKNHTEEAKRNMSAAQKKVHATRPFARTEMLQSAARAMTEKIKIPVICVNDGRVFASVVEAAAFYGFGISSVGQVVRGARSHTHGLVFARYEAPE